MLKIYGSPASSSGRCFWALEEAGVAYERVPLDMRAKEHKSPEYLAINPNGKVPTLVDDSTQDPYDSSKPFTVWESLAINQYIAEAYAPQLLGDKSPRDTSRISQWSVWGLHEFQSPLVEIFIQKVFVPEEKRQQVVIDNAIKKLEPLQNLLNTHLSKSDFLLGKTFSLADINVGTAAYINVSLKNNLADWPALKAWIERLADRPAYKKVLEMGR